MEIKINRPRLDVKSFFRNRVFKGCNDLHTNTVNLSSFGRFKMALNNHSFKSLDLVHPRAVYDIFLYVTL